MSVLRVTFYWTLIIYGLLYDCRILTIYLGLLIGYQLFAHFYYPGNFGSIRKRVSHAIWDPPAEGNIHNRMELDVTKAVQYLKSQEAKDAKITITHICIKALAECLNSARSVANGKIVFGKYIQYDTVDVSCLINVEDGKDLAAVLVKNADKMNFRQISEFINAKAQKAKVGKDEDHKKRIGPIKYFPPLVISILLEFAAFLSYNLGISIPPMAVSKHSFGAATITSLGAFGFKDVTVPFTPFMRSSIIMAVNKIEEKAVVRNGQIVIAPMLIVNFTVDHRFVDGGSALKGTQSIIDVIENPEKYA